MVAPKAKEPAAPEPRRPPISRGDLRASLLHGADYLGASLDAMMVENGEAEFLRKLEVLRSIIVVALDQASEYLRSTKDTLQ